MGMFSDFNIGRKTFLESLGKVKMSGKNLFQTFGESGDSPKMFSRLFESADDLPTRFPTVSNLQKHGKNFFQTFSEFGSMEKMFSGHFDFPERLQKRFPDKLSLEIFGKDFFRIFLKSR